MCQLAVQQNGLALKYVKEPFYTKEMCQLAIQQNDFALTYVRDDFID
jgi:hypothetical protein